jgi:hypothetical protein
MSLQDNITKKSNTLVSPDRFNDDELAKSHVVSLKNDTQQINPQTGRIDTELKLQTPPPGRDEILRQAKSPLQTPTLDVLRSEGVSSWLRANYPKDDYDQRLKDMRRQKAISTFGNLATALGQAAALGIGARQFDKIQDKSASYDEYIQKLKDAQLNYNLNKTNAMYNALNADAQRKAAADEADKTRKFNADEADKTRAYNAALARQNAEIEANRDAYKMAFEAEQNELNRQNRTNNAFIRSSSSGGGSNKDYASLPVNGEIKTYKSQADYERAVIAEAKRLDIDTTRIDGMRGIDEKERAKEVMLIAGEIQRRYDDERATKDTKSAEMSDEASDVNYIFKD